MNFWLELIIIAIAGGVVAIDTTASWQIIISQPLIACTIVGYLLGNYQIGLIIGILLQLPWLIDIPAGAAYKSDGNMGALISAGLAIHLVEHQINTPNISIVFAIACGVLVSWIGAKLVISMRKRNVIFAYRADEAARVGKYKKITLLNIAGIGSAFTMGAILMIVSFTVGVILLSKLVAFIPPYFDEGFGYGKIGILAFGLGTMITMFLSKKDIKYFLIGLVIAFLGYVSFL